ncbi:AmmeMemoRadiSam system protein B [Veronia pacifica]|uniref:MEMO1 family protein A8L45_19325 n=1 Tax=Veronia pacifica TaxID=1080227 RepID=A0A1C3EBT3_9GAMM|nr:AmmeMemoRadiSam system protein B [Veronia pacifica]ODA30688.1 AmmeMemoRadiSam system protein B [Veronia pacifica]
MNIRSPAVAGRFYHDSPQQLDHQLSQWLTAIPDVLPLKALIVPHAGYVFSGKVAAEAYQYLKATADQFERVVLVGPSHHFGFNGVAVPEADYFATPLGNVSIDKEHVEALSQHPMVQVSDHMHDSEHSLEVQIPFLQCCLKHFTLLPIVYSRINSDQLADLVDTLWHDDSTLLVVSTDLSHFHTYSEACALDGDTCQRIQSFDASITPHEACGATGVNMLLKLARQRNYRLTQIDYKNSGDTGGNKNRVVGYVSYLICAV